MKQFATILLLLLITIQISAQVDIDKVIAVVGDNPILQSDVEKQAIQLRTQGYYSSDNIKCEVLEDLLYQKLLINQAKIDSVEVSDNQVNSELNRRIQYFVNSLGSKKKLEEYYGKSILEIKKEFRKIIRDQILSQKEQMEITKDINVTPTDVRKFFNKLKKDSIPTVNTKIQIEQIALYPKISEIEVLAVKKRLENFRKRINKGEKFETLAVLYSEDKGTATHGGKLGPVGRSDLVPEFAAVAFKLKKGQVSRIVKTEYGYHIIQLVEKKGEKIICRHILLKPKVKPELQAQTLKLLDSIKTKIEKDTLTWEKAVTRFSDDKNTKLNNGLLINDKSGNSEFEKNQIEPSIAYAIKNLKINQISSPFKTIDNKGKAVFKIVRIKSKKESHPANIVDDYKLIQDLALQKKKEEYANKWIEQKRSSTYIKIDDEFNSCKFKYNWTK